MGPGTAKKKKKKKKKGAGDSSSSSSSSSGSSDEGIVVAPLFAREPGDPWPGAMVSFEQVFDSFDVAGHGSVCLLFRPMNRVLIYAPDLDP